MLNPDLDHNVLIQHLVNTMPCSECGCAYEAHHVHVVAEEDDGWTLVAFCAECGVECLVHAFVDELDDDADDTTAPPDVAEVAAWAHFLAEFNGDLRDLLAVG
jgi:hypothetical protein